MKYAGIIENDIAAAPGICVSFFTQGCPHHCPECHNPETWDFNGGKNFTKDTIQQILNALKANGIDRKLCIMGGEPLCPNNLEVTAEVIKETKKEFPNKEIFLWTGYTLQELKNNNNNKETELLNFILNNINCLIDGRYEKDKKDTTLFMRGSSNQNIYYFDK